MSQEEAWCCLTVHWQSSALPIKMGCNCLELWGHTTVTRCVFAETFQDETSYSLPLLYMQKHTVQFETKTGVYSNFGRFYINTIQMLPCGSCCIPEEDKQTAIRCDVNAAWICQRFANCFSSHLETCVQWPACERETNLNTIYKQTALNQVQGL